MASITTHKNNMEQEEHFLHWGKVEREEIHSQVFLTHFVRMIKSRKFV
jgi:hypothetical protein